MRDARDRDRRRQLNEGGEEYGYEYTFDRMTKRRSSSHTVIDSYDPAGNVISDEVLETNTQRQFGWDALGRIAYTEDPNSSTTYYYVGGALAHVIDPGGGRTSGDVLHGGDWIRLDLSTGKYTDRIWLGSRLLAERHDGHYELAHRSLGGSVAAVTDDTGVVLHQEEFTPFGQTELADGTTAHETAFHDLRRDEVIVAGPRAYDAASGRWLARDPLVVLEPETFASMADHDGYQYANNNPFGYRDPSGLQAVPTGDSATPDDDLPPGYFLGPNGRVYKADPDAPMEVQVEQTYVEDTSRQVEAIAMVAELTYVPMSFVPGVQAARSFAEGHYVMGTLWATLDVAAFFGAELLDVAGHVAEAGRGVETAIEVAEATCFLAGTPVATERGLIPIEQVTSGTRVACGSAPAHRWDTCEVIRPLQRAYVGVMVSVHVGGDDIQATGDHPFWVVAGKDLSDRASARHLDWLDNAPARAGRWIDAGKLQAGDRLLLAGGREARVDAVLHRWYEGPVYNLEVDSLHTYLVGRVGALVHNRPMMTVEGRAMQISSQIPKDLKQYGRCEEYAAEMQSRLSEAGITGERVRMEYAYKRFPWSNTLEKIGEASTAHEYIRVGDMVFDNLRSEGMSFTDYLEDTINPWAENAGSQMRITKFGP